jgi:hypothetical protein
VDQLAVFVDCVPLLKVAPESGSADIATMPRKMGFLDYLAGFIGEIECFQGIIPVQLPAFFTTGAYARGNSGKRLAAALDRGCIRGKLGLAAAGGMR